LSAKLLDEARRSAAEEPASARRRIEFVNGDVLALGPEHAGRYDLVCCHGVAMYLPSLEETVAALCQACRLGGMVSLLTRNRAGIAMRAGTTGDRAAALEAFDARHNKNRLGIEPVRADGPGEVQAALAAKGASVVAWYGVRLFTDHWGPERPGPDFNELLAAEEEAGHPSSATNCILSRVHPFLATGGYNWRCGHQALMSSVEASTGHPRPQRPAEKAASRLAAPGGAVADARRGVGGDGLGPRRGEAPGRCAGRSPT
jgi:SAM-dependent methyltransferase